MPLLFEVAMPLPRARSEIRRGTMSFVSASKIVTRTKGSGGLLGYCANEEV